jgi:hypothetical protein
MKCYVCDIDITADNETDEHIIINAAGGHDFEIVYMQP